MRKKYERPSIEKVKLVPSEAVLAACKNESTAGPDWLYCITNIVPCSEIGS